LAGANAYIRANWPSFADALADMGAVEHFVVGTGDYANPTYYNSGGVHLTATGYAALAPTVVAAIESLL
jgi:lysophospholipase L1-like esterase